jgi:hypothetical protein
MTLELKPYVRRPFVIEALRITKGNIQEIAALGVGQIKRTKKGTPFIEVNPAVVPHVKHVYPGFWYTKVGDQIRCYSRRVFEDQFTVLNHEAHFALQPYMRAEMDAPPQDEEHPAVTHAKSLEEIQGETKQVIKENVFTPPPVLAPIPPGGTYVPGKTAVVGLGLGGLQNLIAQHQVTDEVHLAEPVAETPPDGPINDAPTKHPL